MKDYKFKKLIIQKCRISKIAFDSKSPPIKDLKTNKFNSIAPDLNRVQLRVHQKPRNKPSMPKMPWD